MLGLSMALGSVGCVTDLLGDDEPPGSDPTDTGRPMLTTTATSASDGTTSTSGPQTTTGVWTGHDSTSEDSGVDDNADNGCSFYAGCAPDGGGQPFECDLFEQDCPEGEKCMPWASTDGSWDATRCTPVADAPAQLAEPCTVEGSATSGIDDCGPGLMCFEVDPKTNEGTCEDLCTGTPSDPMCQEPGDACLVSNGGALVLCLPACNPVMQDCGPGQGCFPNQDRFFCTPSAGPAAAHGDPCSFVNECAAGQLCLDGLAFSACESSTCCSTACALDDPDADLACAALDPGQSCQPWYEEGAAPAGYENVGVCSL